MEKIMTSRKDIRSNKKIIYILSASVAALLLIGTTIFLNADATSKTRFSLVNKEMEQIAKYVTDLGATEYTEHAVVQGNGVIGDSKCWPDENCPFIHRYWSVAVVEGEEGEFIKDVLASEGYEPTSDYVCNFATSHACAVFGEKENVKIQVSISEVQGNAPNDNKDSKQRRNVDVLLNLKRAE